MRNRGQKWKGKDKAQEEVKKEGQIAGEKM
jgi:hypothetical protein